jgi:superfamily II DNA helicase RecQ
MELIKKMKTESKKNILSKLAAGRYFEDFHKSVVVLANPKTMLNSKFAPKEIKEKVIRADQLVTYIKEIHNKSKEIAYSDEGLLAWAQSFLDLHKNAERNYTAKYEQYRLETAVSGIVVQNQSDDEEKMVPVEETDIFKDLKEYRLEKSREEKIKPYYIYNDNQLKDLITKMPMSKDELKKVAGFGEVKANKYGDDILGIIKKYYR